MSAPVIIGIIACVAIVYFVILSIYVKKRKNKQLDNFMATHSNKELTEQQKHALVYGAILSHHRLEKVFNIIPQDRIEIYVHGLKNQWGINSPESAAARLTILSTPAEDEMIRHTPDVEKIRMKIAKELKIEISVVNEVQSAYAWNLGRLVPLAKWCYWCGYITEDEMWQYIFKAVQVAQQFGKDWTDYTISFLLGRTMQGFDLDDVIIEAEQVLYGKKAFLSNSENVDVYKAYKFK